jgi:hypothetical protein
MTEDPAAGTPSMETPPTETPPTETPPDRLSTDPRSPHFNAELLQRGIGIRFKGVEKTNVEEYCVSEGWVRVAVGKTLDRRGNPLTMKLQGTVEPYFRDTAAPAAPREG